MTRLTVENLEGRELMAANVLASTTVPVAPISDTVAAAHVGVNLTPPIGSNTNRIAGDGFGISGGGAGGQGGWH
jgi:uncharacterized membrane protein